MATEKKTPSLSEQMLAKKKIEEAAANAKDTKKDPQEQELQNLVEKKLDLTGNEAGAQDVAAAAGATEVPAIGGVQTGMMTSVVKQTDHPTESEVQTRRTHVSTNVNILPSDPTGTNVADPNPPLGTLPNSNIEFLGEPGSVMGVHGESMSAGLAMNKISDEENEKAMRSYEGELRRQRMLEGRPRDTDLAAEQAETEAPAGGYRSLGMLRFANGSGAWVNAVNGYFVPQTEEEEKMLEHYAKTGAVEAPVEKSDKK